jgi:uncharacterized protein (DUF1697 family)
MTTYVALLRSVNVGGTGKLKMTDLKAQCEAAGFQNVRTFIASGNVLFESRAAEAHVKRTLERQLSSFTGKPVIALVRTAEEMRAIHEANPFPKANQSGAVAIFLDEPPARDELKSITGRTVEQIRMGKREIYVDYAGTLAHSKLKIPAARTGTARNLNTVARLAALVAPDKQPK